MLLFLDFGWAHAGGANARVTYLLKNIVQRVRRINGEADQDDVRVGVRERSETVIIFLASRIPQGQLDVLVVNLDVGDVVLENGGDVDLE